MKLWRDILQFSNDKEYADMGGDLVYVGGYPELPRT